MHHMHSLKHLPCLLRYNHSVTTSHLLQQKQLIQALMALLMLCHRTLNAKLHSTGYPADYAFEFCQLHLAPNFRSSSVLVHCRRALRRRQCCPWPAWCTGKWGRAMWPWPALTAPPLLASSPMSSGSLSKKLTQPQVCSIYFRSTPATVVRQIGHCTALPCLSAIRDDTTEILSWEMCVMEPGPYRRVHSASLLDQHRSLAITLAELSL